MAVSCEVFHALDSVASRAQGAQPPCEETPPPVSSWIALPDSKEISLE